MNKLKSEKGAITLLTLITMLFMLVFLISLYLVNVNKAQAQKTRTEEIKKIYNNIEYAEDIYNNYFADGIIEIYTVEQLLAIGTGNNIIVNGKIYNFSEDAYYVLMDDFKFDVDDYASILGAKVDWIPLGKTNYKFEGNGHKITVTKVNGTVKEYNEENLYGAIEDTYIWKDNGNGTFTDLKTNVTVNLGDFVNYNSGTDYETPDAANKKKGWRILGVENGNLLLISDTIVGTKILKGSDGDFTGGIAKLDKMCEDYQNEYAVKSRSVGIEDINKITGYNPLCVGVKNPTQLQIDTGIKYNYGKADEYGNKVSYIYKDNFVWYQYDNKALIQSSYEQFTNVDGKTLVTEEMYEEASDKTTILKEIELESNAYTYYPDSLTATPSTNEENVVGISTQNVAYDMIFNKYNGTQDSYLIASTCISTGTGNAQWKLRYISDGYVHDDRVWGSNGSSRSHEYGVRAVITLSPKVKLDNPKDVAEKKGVKIYEIK